MICSTLSGMLAIKHPTLGVLVREDGMVFNIIRGGYPITYAWTKGSLRGTTGYSRVVLRGKHYKVHRLVAEAFIPNPENKPTVDHINRVRDDNRVQNLRWATHKEQAENRGYVVRKLVRKPSKYGVRKCENISEYYRKYREAHRDEIREYRKSHRAESREYTRKYRERKKLQDSQCN